MTTLTLGGQFDGLARITRMAEAYYHQVLHPSHPGSPDLPVVVLYGINHMQFASGEPTPLVKARDLKGLGILAVAQAGITGAMTAFIVSTLDSSAPSRMGTLLSQTGTLVGPLITALEMEGFYHFKPPCNGKPPSDQCTRGSRWSEVAQTIMGGLPNSTTLQVTDEFRSVWELPPQTPRISGDCRRPAGCKLQVATVTQNVYSPLDKLDTALVPIAATTMRVKMVSRQSVWTQAGKRKTNFNHTDGGSICAEINRASWQWAVDNAGEAVFNRFKLYGEPLKMAKDLGPYSYPVWAWHDVHYTQKKKGPTMVVSSPAFKTPVDFWWRKAAGLHYCKLLSPARAMEWIYVDGLRAHYSLTSPDPE